MKIIEDKAIYWIKTVQTEQPVHVKHFNNVIKGLKFSKKCKNQSVSTQPPVDEEMFFQAIFNMNSSL